MDILDWYKKNNRLLPWRESKDPYRVWLSEIILQQTRAAQGEKYFFSFLEAFPNIQMLAKAKETDVLKLWEGLGYYSRARNLHYTSQWIMQNNKGVFPNSFSDLLKLKGVGKYTAAAIASICFNEVVPAIDGNAYRVYARYFGVFEDISKSSSWKVFYKIGEEAIDKKSPGDFNQAIMDLGSTICKPKNPDCPNCPVNSRCFAFGSKKTHLLPINNKKLQKKDRFFNYLFVQVGGKIFVKKRVGNDIWKNLYELPLIETKNRNITNKNISIDFSNLKLLSEKKHLLTHQNLHLNFWAVEQNILFNETLEDSFLIDESEIYKLPFPIPILDFLHKMIPIS